MASDAHDDAWDMDRAFIDVVKRTGIGRGRLLSVISYDEPKGTRYTIDVLVPHELEVEPGPEHPERVPDDVWDDLGEALDSTQIADGAG